MQRIALSLLLIATTLSAILLTADLPLVGNKLAVADLFFVSLIFCTGLNMASAGWPDRRMPLEYKILVGLFGMMFVLATLTYAFVAIPRNTAATEGLVALANYAYGILIMLSVIYWVRSLADLEKVAMAWILGSVIVVFFAALAFVDMAPEWAFDGNRVSSTMKSVNQMQSYLAPAFALVSTYLVSERLGPLGKWALTALAVGITFSLLFTGSRSATIFLALILAVILARVLLSRGLGRGLKATVVGLVAVGLVGGASFVNYAQTHGAAGFSSAPAKAMARPITKFTEMAEESQLVERLGPRGEQALIVGQNWYRSPVFGFGPGAFKDRFNHHHEVHNTYLGLLIEQGALGLGIVMAALAYLAFGLMVAIRGSRSREVRRFLTGLLFALMLIYLYGIFDFGIRQRTFWLMLGMSAAGIALARRAEGRERAAGSRGSGRIVPGTVHA